MFVLELYILYVVQFKSLKLENDFNKIYKPSFSVSHTINTIGIYKYIYRYIYTIHMCVFVCILQKLIFILTDLRMHYIFKTYLLQAIRKLIIITNLLIYFIKKKHICYPFNH